MADEEYEILPHQLLQDLKYDVEALKKKLNEPDAKSSELILEIESLKDSIHELTGIFQKALEEMKEDKNFDKETATLKEKMSTMVSQNETIAKGMIAISDKLEKFMESQKGPSAGPRPAAPVFHSMSPPMPMMGNPSRTAPMPDMDSSLGFPPPPPGAPIKKKGLFS